MKLAQKGEAQMVRKLGMAFILMAHHMMPHGHIDVDARWLPGMMNDVVSVTVSGIDMDIHLRACGRSTQHASNRNKDTHCCNTQMFHGNLLN